MPVNSVCNLCGNTYAKPIPFRYLFKGRYLDAVKCTKCSLISIYPQPTPQEIAEMYSDDYFTVADNKTHHGDNAYIESIKKTDYSVTIKFIRNQVKSGNILDIGCATGKLLNELKKVGYKVTGIELSKFAAEYGRKEYGINIINKPYDNLLLGNDLKENSMDCIYMGDVLEHFTNPSEAMKLSVKILKKGGILITHVPGTLNLISSRLAFIFYRLTGAQKTMTLPPFHLTEFSPGTLKKMFLMNGFSKVQIIQQAKHPNTIPLRHSKIENFIKLSLQYPNYFLTKYVGIYGDRITGIGTK
jgi:2-polyprenyl-3-methyl-5-hydroxy-6-metoxy-1,4-benzoquinol methylase